MDIQQFYEYCLSKKGVTEHFPFNEDTLVLKIGGKMFLLSSLSSWENGNPKVNLKCDPERAQELRDNYDGIQPGYHMSKKHWNTISINEDVADTLVKELIDHSYAMVFRSLPNKIKKEILSYDWSKKKGFI